MQGCPEIGYPLNKGVAKRDPLWQVLKLDSGDIQCQMR
nr:MAG TPA: hypothetical protein [Caudoviricetes sp.]